MTRHAELPGIEFREDPGLPPAESRDITLRPLFTVVWRYRHVIIGSIAFIVAAFALVMSFLYFTLPIERTARLGFRLLFDGAQRGEYPNGLRFSASDIVETPVLTDVFASNQLSNYGTYEEFKEAIYVLRSNPALEFLAYEYESKLADARLTPVERAQIEEEYRNKQQSITDPVFTVMMRRTERFQRMPPELMSQVLSDILGTWSQWARERKGAFKYTVPVLSGAFLKEEVRAHQNPVIAIDILRSNALEILDNIEQVSALPGAAVVRSGELKVSLADVKADLEYIIRFQLQPAVALARAQGAASADALRWYVDQQLVQLRVQQEESRSRLKAIQDPLRAYVQGAGASSADPPAAGRSADAAQAVTLSDTFLDRLMAITTQASDVLYRQDKTNAVMLEGRALARIDREIAYYDQLRQSTSGVGRPVAAEEVSRSIETAYAGIARALSQFTSIYDELSNRNLSPATELFAITAPFSMRSTRALSLMQIMMYGVVIVLASVMFVPALCIAHHYAQRAIASQTAPPPAPRRDTMAV